MLKDFKENEKRTEKVLVLGVEEKKTARGSAFIVCSVTDGETKLEVKFWNTTKLMFEMFIHKDESGRQRDESCRIPCRTL